MGEGAGATSENGNDYEELIQQAAHDALSPWCDPDDDVALDSMADRVRDAVRVAFEDHGLSVVLTDLMEDREVRLQGHKLFFSRKGDNYVIEAVTDDRPLTRMLFELTDDEWRDFAEGAGFDAE